MWYDILSKGVYIQLRKGVSCVDMFYIQLRKGVSCVDMFYRYN